MRGASTSVVPQSGADGPTRTRVGAPGDTGESPVALPCSWTYNPRNSTYSVPLGSEADDARRLKRLHGSRHPRNAPATGGPDAGLQRSPRMVIDLRIDAT